MKHYLLFIVCLLAVSLSSGCKKPSGSDGSEETQQPSSQEPLQGPDVITGPESVDTPLAPEPGLTPDSLQPQSRTFADATIGQFLKDLVGKPFGQLTEEELQAFNTLKISNREIENLSGVEKLANLETLSVGKNYVSSVAPLAGLEYLTEVDVSTNQIEDIAALGQVPNLTTLSIGGNMVRDVSALASLKNLEHLAISDNLISDASPLGKITTLKSLQISDTFIRSLEGFETLAVLEELYLENTFIEDVTPLHSLKNLKRLNLHGTYVSLEKIAALKAAVPGLEIAHDPEPKTSPPPLDVNLVP